ATLMAVGAQPLAPGERQAIRDRFAALVDYGRFDTLRLTLPELPAEPLRLRVRAAAGSAEDSLLIDPGPIAPQFNVQIDPVILDGPVEFSIRIVSQQAPIREVVYLIDNRPVQQQPITNAPEFALQLDTSDPEFQRRFPPGEYRLSASATNAAGLSSHSAQEIMITVVAPVHRESSGTSGWLITIAVLALGALLTGSLALWRTMQRTAAEPQPIQPAAAAPATVILPPAHEPATVLSSRWALEISGDAPDSRQVMLPARPRIYIGRPSTEAPSDIEINHRQVSRQHLELAYDAAGDTWRLLVRETGNGTFFGMHREPLAPTTERVLHPNDLIWLGQVVLVKFYRKG
ncbi:MAG TPA: FHA domain-containing protein, partial [Roseiflexaceae bacterium]|nr:FHA domain-containing protein [Roseiflexaceae bacterium]